MNNFFSKEKDNPVKGTLERYFMTQYDEADTVFGKRFVENEESEENEKKIEEFDKMLQKLASQTQQQTAQVQQPTSQVERHRVPEAEKLRDLAIANLYLRKGQCRDESFYDPQECYKQAAALLWKLFEKNGSTPTDLLIHLNIGKYFRNIGKRGHRSDSERALDEFRSVKEKLSCRLKSDVFSGHALTQAMHLLLDAEVNIGRVSLDIYYLDEAKTSFLRILRYLSPCMDEEKQRNIKSIIKTAELDERLDSITFPKYLDDYNKRNLTKEFLDSYVSEAMLQLGIVFRKEQKYECALKIFDLILSTSKSNGGNTDNNTDQENGNIDALNNKGVCFRKLYRLNEAERIFHNLLRKGNRFATVNYIKCCIKHMNRNDPEGSAPAARWDRDTLAVEIGKRMETNPNDNDMLFLWGKYNSRLGDWDKAEKIFRELYDKNTLIGKGTIGLKAYYNVAQCLINQKKFHQAIKVLEKIQDELGLIVGIRSGLGKSDAPEADAGKSPDANQKDLMAAIELGWCLMNTGEYKRALKIYEEIIKDPHMSYLRRVKQMMIRNNLGECLLHLGEAEKARKHFDEVLSLEKDNAEAKYFLAKCQVLCAEELMKKGDLKDAREEYVNALANFREASQISPQDIRIHSGWITSQVKLLEIDDWKDENQIDDIESSLCYYPYTYSLKACTALVSFIEHQEEETKSEDKAENEAGRLTKLYEALYKIHLDENEEGSHIFEHLHAKHSFRRLPRELKGKILARLYRIYEYISEIKGICRYPSIEDAGNAHFPVHYTSIDSLKHLLAGNVQDPPRLRLWNTVYMNDTFEGEEFIRLMEMVGKGIDSHAILDRYFRHLSNSPENMIPVNSNVYIASLAKGNENTQMWVAYADNATGCNITFENDFFDIRNTSGHLSDVSVYSDDDYPLYQVQYIDAAKLIRDGVSEDSSMQNILSYIERIWSYLKDLEDILEDNGRLSQGITAESTNQNTVSSEEKQWESAKSHIRSFVTDCLNEIRFLFKTPEYAYEQELRTIHFSYCPKIDEKNFPIPRHYIEVEREIQMDEVRLGTKIDQMTANEIVSWLCATGKVKKVTKSTLHYR